MLLDLLCRNLIARGELIVVDASKRRHSYGDARTGPSVTIRLHDRSLPYRLFLNPRLAVGEAYMDGTLTLEKGDLYSFLDLVGLNLETGDAGRADRSVLKLRSILSRFQVSNSRRRAKWNVAHHYDLDDGFFDLFLDSRRQYSCAYFRTPDDDLEKAQEQKIRHIAAKLRLEPNMTVLDIGSGWGGLAFHLAEHTGAHVTGITLSEPQLNYARARARERGLQDRTRFLLRDYRDQTGRFDRIVSVGMLEHVGLRNYPEFFSKVGKLLTNDGVALIHFISHRDPPAPTNPWLEKYIFPGGYAPALSQVLPAIERTGCWVSDVEILRLHYAETLKHWRERFLSNWDKASDIYGERFCRMWEFFLAGGEMAHRRQGDMVVQIQLAKSVGAVPVTRDYIFDFERQDETDKARREPRRLQSVP